MYGWYELTMHLDESMLESLQFCHHCLIFLPKPSFDFRGTGGTLIRFDCLLLMKRRCQYDEYGGCGILHDLLMMGDGEGMRVVSHVSDSFLGGDVEKNGFHD